MNRSGGAGPGCIPGPTRQFGAVRNKLVPGVLLFLAAPVVGQNPFLDSSEELDLSDPNTEPDFVDSEEPPIIPDIGGLRNFLEYEYIGTFFIILGIATGLGALIGYQPKYGGKVDSVDAIETPKICILYSVVGAVIGTMVQKYGMVIGFVVFGIGGLFRFRTNLGSARKTVRVILATLIGLSCGLHLPHMGTASALFAFVLLYILDRSATYRILIKSLPHEEIPGAAAAYRELLEDAGCHILSEKKNFLKSQVSFAFKVKQTVQPDDLQLRFDDEIPENYRGSIDWDVR